MSKNLSDSFWKEIEKRKTVPIPVWRFVAKNYGLWLLVSLFVVISSIAMATLSYVLFSHDLDVEQVHTSNLIEWSLVLNILQSIPYLWIIIVALVSLIALLTVRSTKNGYRYSKRMVISISLLSTLIFSISFSIFDIGKYAHRYLSIKLPAYNKVVYGNEQHWSQPEKGYLGGKIIFVSVKDHFLLVRDFRNTYWRVDISKVKLHKGTHLASGYYLKITGVKVEKLFFYALTLQDWDETYYQ
ncbi:MAG: hypothetical protein WCG19_01720 [Chlorobiaceae bacterium]